MQWTREHADLRATIVKDSACMRPRLGEGPEGFKRPSDFSPARTDLLVKGTRSGTPSRRR